MTPTAKGATIGIWRAMWDRPGVLVGRAAQSNIEKELGMTGFEEYRQTDAMTVPS